MGLGSFKCNRKPPNVYFSNFYTRVPRGRRSSAKGLGVGRIGRHPKKHSATSSQVLVNPAAVGITNEYSGKYEQSSLKSTQDISFLP